MRLSLEILTIRLTAVAAICLSPANLYAGSSHWTTVHVPRDHASIQQALDAAAPGTRIRVARGEYQENLSLQGAHELVLEGERGVTILSDGAADYGLEIEDCQNITIRRLMLRNGIYLENSTGITLEKLKLEATRREGVAAHGCDDLAINRCEFRSTMSAGVYIWSGERVRLIRNKVWGAGATGIAVMEVDGSTRDALVERNRIYSAHGIGILVRGEESTVIGNRASRCRTGLSCGGGDSLIAGNRVTASEHHAVVIGGDGVTVMQNRVRYGLTYGLQLSGSRALVSGNRVQDCVGDGVHFFGEDSTFRRNRVRSTGADGLYILGNRNQISRSRVKAAGQMGVRVHGNSNDLTRNRVKRSLEYDLSVRGVQNRWSDNDIGTYDPGNPN